jgi:hypothetical protein
MIFIINPPSQIFLAANVYWQGSIKSCKEMLTQVTRTLKATENRQRLSYPHGTQSPGTRKVLLVIDILIKIVVTKI